MDSTNIKQGMTLSQTKDSVAKEAGYKSFDELMIFSSYSKVIKAIDLIAIKYHDAMKVDYDSLEEQYENETGDEWSGVWEWLRKQQNKLTNLPAGDKK